MVPRHAWVHLKAGMLERIADRIFTKRVRVWG